MGIQTHQISKNAFNAYIVMEKGNVKSALPFFYFQKIIVIVDTIYKLL
ncbi:hypothetical protein MTBPR1_80041 [Candidatus Terasakiella magnetica]|uniref:Uncharacterized protein n=1 Tax=Candidatus Terasakiella magnetica TaxID=1867952 RepID=A0A1C3RL59_9PROT|nr:hypothetical protein MTBPR1_80041 [Candidatus Terasakiella magnetica]